MLAMSSALNRYTHFLMAQDEPSRRRVSLLLQTRICTSRLVCKDMRQLAQCEQSAATDTEVG
jgi:hypothetical protein